MPVTSELAPLVKTTSLALKTPSSPPPFTTPVRSAAVPVPPFAVSRTPVTVKVPFVDISSSDSPPTSRPVDPKSRVISVTVPPPGTKSPTKLTKSPTVQLLVAFTGSVSDVSENINKSADTGVAVGYVYYWHVLFIFIW